MADTMEVANSMEELRGMDEKLTLDSKVEEEVKTADELCKAFLMFLYPEMHDAGVIRMYFAQKDIINDMRGTEGLQLCREAVTSAIDVIAYNRDMLAIANEVEG